MSTTFAAECARLAALDNPAIQVAVEFQVGALETVLAALRLASRATVEGIAGVMRDHLPGTVTGNYVPDKWTCRCGVYGSGDIEITHTAHVAERIVAYLRGRQ